MYFLLIVKIEYTLHWYCKSHILFMLVVSESTEDIAAESWDNRTMKVMPIFWVPGAHGHVQT